MRSEIRLITRYGMPAFSITINPSDLRNPPVPILADLEYSGDKVFQRKYYYDKLATFGMGN
jgi:hypothetical protein